MSAEKYMDRAIRAANDALPQPVSLAEFNRVVEGIAALCAEIEAETIDKCIATFAEMAEEEPLNLLKIAAAIRAGKP